MAKRKNKRDPLFDLIQSMDRSEKRYFKVFSAQQKRVISKNYLQLFDVLAKMKSYDESKLLKAFQGKNLARHLSSEKNYLWRMIFKSLRSYQAQKSEKNLLRIEMENAAILKKKGLYEQYEKQLKRIRKKATEEEDLAILLETLNEQIHFLTFRGRKEMLDQQQELLALKNKTLQMINRGEEVRSLYQSAVLYSRLAKKRISQEAPTITEEELRRIEGLPDEELTVEAQIFREKLLALWFRSQRNLQQAFVHQSKVIELRETHPRILKKAPNNYKVDLANYLSIAFSSGNNSGIPSTIQKIRDLPPASFDEEAEMFQNVFFYELVWHLNQGAWNTGNALVLPIEKGLQTYGIKVNKGRELGFYYNIAVLYLFQARWKDSLTWIRKIIHADSSEHRQDLQAFARILSLILHAELGNLDLLEYRIPNLRRYLREKGRWLELDTLLFACLNQILKSGGVGIDQLFWQQTESKFTEILGQLGRGAPVGSIECHCWIKSKAGQKDLQQVFKEYAS